jgi:hypothetical protein
MDQHQKSKLALLGGSVIVVVGVAGGLAEVSGYSLRDWLGTSSEDADRGSTSESEVPGEPGNPRPTLRDEPFAPPTNTTVPSLGAGDQPTPSGGAANGGNPETGRAPDGQDSGGGATTEMASIGGSAPEQSVYDAVKFPLQINPVSVTLRRSNYQFQLPDLIRLEATVTLTVTNKSDRVLRLGWLDPYDNLRLNFRVGPQFSGSHDDYHGLPVCTHSPGSCDNDRRSSPLSPSETVSLVATLSGSVPPDEVEKLLRQSKASVVGQLVVVPRGTRPEYAETFSFGSLPVGDQ